LALDWVVLADWIAVALVISVVVGIAHSFFGLGADSERRRRLRASGLAQPAIGYFIQVTSQDADSMLLYGEELLKRGNLDDCVKTAYSAAEEFLQLAAAKMSVPPEHSTLADFGRRLTAAGLLRLEIGELELLDMAARYVGEPLNPPTATRALGAAFYLRNYFMHAPLSLPSDKKPIGSDAPSNIQA
jgi:hypothetical protein